MTANSGVVVAEGSISNGTGAGVVDASLVYTSAMFIVAAACVDPCLMTSFSAKTPPTLNVSVGAIFVI